jgi:protein phosphatase 1 regulatory subunit 10
MPRIDPHQLLKTLGVLLAPHGGIKSSEEVVRLVQLMQKFSRKLVSKCIYIRILKASSFQLLELFLCEKGWELLNQWFSDAIKTQNWPLTREMIQLFDMCPITASRLKENVEDNHAPKLINLLRQEPSVEEDIKLLASEVYVKWVRIVSPDKVLHRRRSSDNAEANDSENNSESDSKDSRSEAKDGAVSLLQSLAEEVSANIKKDENKKVYSDKSEKKDQKIPSKVENGKSLRKSDDRIRDKPRSQHSHSSSHDERDKDKDRSSKRESSSSKHSTSKERDKNKEHRRYRHTDVRDEVNDEEKQRIKEKARKLKEEAQAKKDKETLNKVNGGSSTSSLSKIPKIPKKVVKEEEKKKGSSFSDMLGTLDSKPSTWRKPLLKNKTAAMLETMTKPSTHKSSKENSLKSSPSSQRKEIIKDKELQSKKDVPVSSHKKDPSTSNKNSNNGETRRPSLSLTDASKVKKSPEKESPKSGSKSPAIVSSTGFMDAIFSTMKKEDAKDSKKRKRRLSDRDDPKTEEKKDEKDQSPEKKIKEDAHAGTTKDNSTPIPTFSFYRELDTSDTSREESKSGNVTTKSSPNLSNAEGKNGKHPKDKDGDIDLKELKVENDDHEMDDNVIPFEDEATDSMPREVKGILVYHRGKDKRNKRIRWKAESTLVSVRYFEMDEDERVNVNKQKFENMREFETKMEKAAISQASKTDMLSDEQETANWYKPVPLTFDENSEQKPCFTAFGNQSTEKNTQADREKTVLQALYFNLETTPSTPSEPDNTTDIVRGLSNGVIMIPLDDKEADEGSCHDYTNEGWPEATMNKVENEYAANLSSAFSLPPALSSLLATIETGGLESIIPSPGSLSQEDQSTLAAQTAALQKLGMIPGVDLTPTFPPPLSTAAPNGNGMPMNNQPPPRVQAHNGMQTQSEGLDAFGGPGITRFPPPMHGLPPNITQHAPFAMAPPQQMQDNGNFNSFGQPQMQQNPFLNGPFQGNMHNHRGGNQYGRGGNTNGFRGGNNGQENFNRERDRNWEGRRNNDEPPPSKIRTRPCKFFMERGTCRDGERCNFIHQQS